MFVSVLRPSGQKVGINVRAVEMITREPAVEEREMVALHFAGENNFLIIVGSLDNVIAQFAEAAMAGRS